MDVNINIFIKGKTFFGLRRRPEKRRKSSSKNKESKKNVLVVKLNPLKLKLVFCITQFLIKL